MIRALFMLTRSEIPVRAVELLGFIGVIVVALIWAERMAWRQISDLRRNWSAEQISHLRFSDELRSGILALHAEWRREMTSTNAQDRSGMEAATRRVRALIADHNGKTNALSERSLVREIAANLEPFLQRIQEALAQQQLEPGAVPSPAPPSEVEWRFARLLDLTEALAAIKRSAADSFIADANAALSRLQRFVFLSLAGLLGCGMGLILLIYRRTIAPLQNTLTQSRAVIDRQEKLASLGVLATGIAHEIRNPLTAIKVRLFSLKASHPAGASEQEDLEVIENEIDRLERIVRDFLQFARPADPELQTMPAGKLLQDTAQLLASELDQRALVLRLDLQSNDPIQIDADKMKQVLINFVHNAADSMKGGGTILLRSRQDRQVIKGKAVDVVVLDIVDSGKGMPPEVQKRLFDPFFTTKEQGTGLGLPIAARIVEKHGGIIQYQTEPNRGTTFSIVLPLASTDENQS